MEGLLKQLDHASPLLRRQAAYGLFALHSGGGGGGGGAAGAAPSPPSSQQQQQLQDVATAVLSSCHADVAEEGVAQLLRLAGGGGSAGRLAPVDALHLLLLALAGAGAATAPVLAAGVVPLLALQASSGDGAPAATLQAGARHPLCAALLSHPAAAPVVLLDATNWLAAAAQAGDSGAQLPRAWSALEPFFSFVLQVADDTAAAAAAAGRPGGGAVGAGAGAGAGGLAMPGGNGGAPVPSALLAQLLAVAACEPAAGPLVLPFALRQLQLWRADSGGQRLVVARALSDVLDALAAAAAGDAGGDGGPTPAWWRAACEQAAELLLLLTCRCVTPLAAGGSGGGLAMLLPLLWRLAGELCPGVLRPRLLPLAFLLLAVAAQEEQEAVLRLIHAQLQEPGAPLPPWQAAALQLPLLQLVVFGTRRSSKAWAGAVLRLLRDQPPASAVVHRSAEAEQQQQQQQGPLATLAVAEQLLASWWAAQDGAAAARRWLHELRGAVAEGGRSARGAGGATGSMTAAAAAGAALGLPLQPAARVRQLEGAAAGDADAAVLSAGDAAWFAAAGANPAGQLVLAALLQHPHDGAAVEAAAAVQQLLVAAPRLAPSWLPLALAQLRGASLSPRRSAALLSLLPAMCADAAVAAIVWRMLAPLLALAGSTLTADGLPRTKRSAASGVQQQHQQQQHTGLARAVALQLAVDAWLQTGRGWNRAEAAVNGCARPVDVADGSPAADAAAHEPLELRVARAAATSRVLEHSTARGLELLGSLQASLCDPAPAVAALALAGLDGLLARDDVDFYGAWPVVGRALPPRALLPAVGVGVGAAAAGTTGGVPALAAAGEPAGVLAAAVAEAAARAAPGLHTPAGAVAARWAALLRYGALDATAAPPEQARAAVGLMRLAARAAEAQVRAAAYGALGEWPPELLERLELPAAAADFVGPLAAEAAALAAALSSGDAAPAALRAHADAVAAAEELALVAVRHEDGQRRRFLALAGGGGGAGYGSRQATGSSGTDEAALRHRLLRTLPAALLADSVGQQGCGAGVHPSPGAVLLLWQPPTAGGEPAAARAYADVAARWGGAGGPAQCGVSAGQAAGAWPGFMSRWLAAAGRAPEALLPRLRAAWAGGLPGAAAAALSAAAGLASAGVLTAQQLDELLAELQGIASGGGGGRSAVVVAAAAAALARSLPAIHPADAAAREAAVQALYGAALDALSCCGGDDGGGGGAPGGGRQYPPESACLAAALLEALGGAAAALLQQSQADETPFGDGGGGGGAGSVDGASRAAALGCSCLGLLASVVAALFPELRGAVDAALGGQLPPRCRGLVSLQPLSLAAPLQLSADVAAAALRGTLASLWLLHPPETAAATPADMPALAAAVLHAAAAAAAAAPPQPGGAPPPAAAGRQLALVAAVPAAAAACVVAATLPQDGLSSALASMRALAVGGIEAAAPTAAHAQLAGAAALSWAQLLCLGLRTPGSTVGDADLAQLVGQLAPVVAPPAAGDCTPLPTSLRSGAAAGLAVLLGVDVAAGSCGESTAAVVTSAAGARGDPAARGWGAGLPGTSAGARARVARAALKALEAAAELRGGAGGTASSIAPLAAWLLSAACAAARGGGGARPAAMVGQDRAAGAPAGAAAAAVAPPALTLYPESGALRPLAERALAVQPGALLGSGGGGGSLAEGLDAAACLRCLAAAPRLPSADWPAMCRRVLATPLAGGAGAKGAALLQAKLAVVRLLLAHARTPGLELGATLDACLTPGGLRQLPPVARAELLRGLRLALLALPISRAAALLHGLPAAVRDLAPAGGGGGQEAGDADALLLVTAAWAGLAHLLADAADSAGAFTGAVKPLREALRVAVAGLAAGLPPLPAAAPPTELLRLARGDAAAADAELDALLERQQQRVAWGLPPSTAAEHDEPPQGASSGGTAVSRVWAGALACLHLAPPDQLLHLTAVAAGASGGDPNSLPPPATPLVVALQLRGLLAAARRLSWKELTPARHALLRLPAGAAAAAVGPLALGCASAPQAGLLQQLRDTADAARVVGGDALLAAAALAAAVVAAWPGAGGATPLPEAPPAATIRAAAACAALERAVAAPDPLRALPATLPLLLCGAGVVGSRAALADELCRVLLDLRAPATSAHLLAAVAAVRELLPATSSGGGGDAWSELAVAAAATAL